MKFGEKVRDLRKKHSLTQDELAQCLGINKRTIIGWERDGRYPRSIEMLEKMADMLIEKMNAIFPLCHRIFFRLFPILSLNVHATTAENGTIMITFSIHSVVSCLSPFTVSQMPQPPITSDNGFIHRFRFNRVLNRIIDVTKVSKNSFRKNTLSLNF